MICSHLWAPRVILVLEANPLVGAHECNGGFDFDGRKWRSQEQWDLISKSSEFLEKVVVNGLHHTLEEVLIRLDHHFPGYYSANRETNGRFKVIAFGRIIPETKDLQEWEFRMVKTYSEYVCGKIDLNSLGVCTKSASTCEDSARRSLATNATHQHISIGQVGLVFALGFIIILILRKYVFNS